MTGFNWDHLMAVLFAAAVTGGQAILHVTLIVFLGAVAVRLILRSLSRLTSILTKAGEATESVPGGAQKRAETLTGLLRTVAVTVIWAVVAVLSLAQVGLDVTPILAGAGIIGLAVGFGAQNLVRDLISGFFIILEDQVRLGDVAIINGTGGLVEAITFRTITLRDFSQVVHVFPNGTITTLSNMTKGWSAFVLDMGVAYKEDTDRVAEVMRQVGEDLRQDPQFREKMLEPLEVIGVDNFADSGVILRVRIKTKPIEQWTVGREYRRRLKKAFDAHKIEIPFPRHSLYMGEASAPFKVQVFSERETPARSGAG
jgi:small conductance mechanosensitive channel